MTTAITVVNAALRELGAEPITSFDEGSDIANTCADAYVLIRDEVLRSHPWNFATFQASLSPMQVAPVYGWTYQFAWPEDPHCLKVIHTQYNEPHRLATYKTGAQMTRVIWANVSPLNLEYIGRVEPLELWDTQAVALLQARLEEALALTITGQLQKKQYAGQKAGALHQAATTSDGQEGTARQVAPNRLLQHGRYRGRIA